MGGRVTGKGVSGAEQETDPTLDTPIVEHKDSLNTNSKTIPTRTLHDAWDEGLRGACGCQKQEATHVVQTYRRAETARIHVPWESELTA